MTVRNQSLPQSYYSRLQGQWSWHLSMRPGPWRELLRQPVAGLQLWLLYIWQKIAGPLQFWTEVGEVSREGLRHKTRISKWGLTLFESDEQIDFVGARVRIHGKQFVWPLRWREQPLGPFDGEVRSGSTAHYNFEVLGIPCDFQTDFVEGYMNFTGRAVSGSIVFDAPCKARLAQLPLPSE